MSPFDARKEFECLCALDENEEIDQGTFFIAMGRFVRMAGNAALARDTITLVSKKLFEEPNILHELQLHADVYADRCAEVLDRYRVFQTQASDAEDGPSSFKLIASRDVIESLLVMLRMVEISTEVPSDRGDEWKKTLESISSAAKEIDARVDIEAGLERLVADFDDRCFAELHAPQNVLLHRVLSLSGDDWWGSVVWRAVNRGPLRQLADTLRGPQRPA
ncbi:MAG: hypothetical protein ABIO72_05545 [Patescibacteria group bacterium]